MSSSAEAGQLNRPGAEGRVTALIEIYTLLNRYAYLARDHLDWETLGKMFRPDAKVQLANGKIVPHSDMKLLMQTNGPSYMRHHITAIDTHFSNDKEALVKVQWFATTELSARDHWGEWEDIVSCDTDGVWLIAEKKIKFEGMDPKGVAAGMAAEG